VTTSVLCPNRSCRSPILRAVFNHRASAQVGDGTATTADTLIEPVVVRSARLIGACVFEGHRVDLGDASRRPFRAREADLPVAGWAELGGFGSSVRCRVHGMAAGAGRVVAGRYRLVQAVGRGGMARSGRRTTRCWAAMSRSSRSGFRVPTTRGRIRAIRWCGGRCGGAGRRPATPSGCSRRA